MVGLAYFWWGYVLNFYYYYIANMFSNFYHFQKELAWDITVGFLIHISQPKTGSVFSKI